MKWNGWNVKHAEILWKDSASGIYYDFKIKKIPLLLLRHNVLIFNNSWTWYLAIYEPLKKTEFDHH